MKDDDWLAERAEQRLNEYDGELEASLATFIELFLIEECYAFDREQAILAILELADVEVDEDILFQASEYVEDGLNTFDAFHAALAGETIISSDKAFEDVSIECVRLEPEA